MNGRHRENWLVFMPKPLLVALGAALLVGGPFVSGRSTATVTMESGSVPPGGSETVRLKALNVDAPGIGAVTIDIQYDNTVVGASACAPDVGNRLDLDQCKLDYGPSKMRMTGISVAGALGDIALADITFQAIGNPGECSPLVIQVATLADPEGTPITHTVQDGQLCVSSPTPTSTATPTATATAAPTSTPPCPDSDGDRLCNGLDPCSNDDDCDDDGLMDGSEDLDTDGVLDPGETDPLNWDSDGDGLSDGLERGLGAPEGQDTDTTSAHWQPDADPSTRTDPLSPDTDGDTIADGQEDVNANGAVDDGESDPGLVTALLAQGWTQICYVGESMPVDQALDAAIGGVLAVYRLEEGRTWGRWFRDRPDLSTITALSAYDQLFVLASQAATWNHRFAGTSQSSAVLTQGWNSVCYSGATTDMDSATAGISGQIQMIYSHKSDQTWARYVPGRPDLSDLTQAARFDAFLVLVTREGATTWEFGP